MDAMGTDLVVQTTDVPAIPGLMVNQRGLMPTVLAEHVQSKLFTDSNRKYLILDVVKGIGLDWRNSKR